MHTPMIPHEFPRRTVDAWPCFHQKVVLRGPWLDTMLPTKWDPHQREIGNLAHRLVVHQRATVVGEVAGVPVDGVVGGEDREDGVHRVYDGLVDGVDGGDEQVDARKISFVGGTVLVSESGQVWDAFDGVELGKLVEEP